MGNCCSQNDAKSIFRESQAAGYDVRVVHFLSASDVPRADIDSESDPYIVAYVISKTGNSDEVISNKIKTLRRTSTRSPVWNSYQHFFFPKSKAANAWLKCEIWDADYFTSDDKIATLEISLNELGSGKDIEKEFTNLQYEKGTAHPKLILRQQIFTSLPRQKIFFIIRHGESKWNEAEAHHDVAGLIHHDHSLTKLGIEQAANLRTAMIRECDSEKYLERNPDVNSLNVTELSLDYLHSLYIDTLKKATHVFSSPLTRAVETALTGMEGHEALKKNGLTLFSNIREVKNMGGMDTVGIAVDEGIKERVKSELLSDVGEERMLKLTDVQFNVNDCAIPWWNIQASSENPDQQQERVREFLRFTRFNGIDKAVYVGHSLFFKAFYSKRISDKLKQKRPHMADDMKTKKLNNACMMAVLVSYPDNPEHEPVIEDAELLFGSSFHHGHDDDEVGHIGVTANPTAKFAKTDDQGLHAPLVDPSSPKSTDAR